MGVSFEPSGDGDDLMTIIALRPGGAAQGSLTSARAKILLLARSCGSERLPVLMLCHLRVCLRSLLIHLPSYLQNFSRIYLRLPYHPLVSRLRKRGAESGEVQLGDKIVAVNGRSARGCSVQDLLQVPSSYLD